MPELAQDDAHERCRCGAAHTHVCKTRVRAHKLGYDKSKRQQEGKERNGEKEKEVRKGKEKTERKKERKEKGGRKGKRKEGKGREKEGKKKEREEKKRKRKEKRRKRKGKKRRKRSRKVGMSMWSNSMGPCIASWSIALVLCLLPSSTLSPFFPPALPF